MTERGGWDDIFRGPEEEPPEQQGGRHARPADHPPGSPPEYRAADYLASGQTALLERPLPAFRRAPSPLPPPKRQNLAARALTPIGRAFALALDVLRLTFRRPMQVREFIEQFWFVASVSILPAALVSIPFGAVIALQLGSLTVQIGAQSFTGAASVLAVVQQASPIVTALMIAGAAGTAICADLGARTIREEIDAMTVLGVSPIQRLIVPRVWASVFVAMLLNGMVSVVGIIGGYAFNVFAQHGTPGAYLSSFSALAQLSDLWVGEIKAIIFGFIAAVVASYRGLHPRPGPKGVGDAVNESVVITFVLLFLVNLAITTIYVQIVPPKGA